MTDRPTTASDVNATIDQIEQALAESADVGQLTMNGIEHLLGGMWQKADAARQEAEAAENAVEVAKHNSALTAINDAWGSIQSLAQHSQHNREAALTMTDIAATMRNQRDNAVKDLETLTKAVDKIDTDHPLVAELVESVTEDVNEWNSYVQEDEDFATRWEQRESYKNAMKRLCGCTSDAATGFLDMLEGDTQISQQQIELMKALLDTFGVEETDELIDDEDGGDYE